MFTEVVDCESGVATLEWTPFRHPAFRSYQVWRQVLDFDNLTPVPVGAAVIMDSEDVTRTSFVDSIVTQEEIVHTYTLIVGITIEQSPTSAARYSLAPHLSEREWRNCTVSAPTLGGAVGKDISVTVVNGRGAAIVAELGPQRSLLQPGQEVTTTSHDADWNSVCVHEARPDGSIGDRIDCRMFEEEGSLRWVVR